MPHGKARGLSPLEGHAADSTRGENQAPVASGFRMPFAATASPLVNPLLQQ
jgi:hypothetical protein